MYMIKNTMAVTASAPSDTAYMWARISAVAASTVMIGGKKVQMIDSARVATGDAAADRNPTLSLIR